jgi:hypothetical protein
MDMLRSGTTAAAIDAFESRLTITNGGHFLVAEKGGQAWPISADESDEFRALYRRRMVRARWIRRLAIFGFIPLLYFGSWIAGLAPDSWQPAFRNIGPFILLVPFAGLIQHMATSDLTNRSIERRMKRRMTLDPASVTPAPTPLGRLANRLFSFVMLGEIAMIALHFFLDRGELAQHMRVLMAQTAGNESHLAWATGTIGRILPVAGLAAIVVAMIDRGRKRATTEKRQKQQRL